MKTTTTMKQRFPLARLYQPDLEGRFMRRVYAWAALNELDLNGD